MTVSLPAAITSDNTHLSEPTGSRTPARFAVNCNSADTTRDPFAVNCTDGSLRDLLEAAWAPNTLRAYRSDLEHFRAWGGSLPAPPEMIAAYVAAHADRLAVATIRRRLVSIGRAHARLQIADPTRNELVRLTVRGVRRKFGRPQRQVRPLERALLEQIVGQLTNSVLDVRDRAILCLGFAGAMRRSELVALQVEDLAVGTRGMEVTFRQSKSDQFRQGRTIFLPREEGPICPVTAIENWLKTAVIGSGWIFRQLASPERLSGRAIAEIVKFRVKLIGLDPNAFSGHSLRAGWITTVAGEGLPIWKIKEQSRHATVASVEKYVREISRASD